MKYLVAQILYIFNKNTLYLFTRGRCNYSVYQQLNAYFQRIFSSIKSVTTYVFYFLSVFVAFRSFDRSFSHPCMFLFTSVQGSTTLLHTALPAISVSHPERHTYQIKFPGSNGL